MWCERILGSSALRACELVTLYIRSRCRFRSSAILERENFWVNPRQQEGALDNMQSYSRSKSDGERADREKLEKDLRSGNWRDQASFPAPSFWCFWLSNISYCAAEQRPVRVLCDVMCGATIREYRIKFQGLMERIDYSA
jgi:hypothetical protein